jgi:hypothetical protein
MILKKKFPTAQVMQTTIVIHVQDNTLNHAMTYLQAFQADPKKNTFPNSNEYVNVLACQSALLSIKQVLWFETTFLPAIQGNVNWNVIVVTKLLRLIIKLSPDLSRVISQFDQLVIIYWALKEYVGLVDLAGGLRQIFAYLASGSLLSGGDLVIDPVKDYQYHLFSKLTRQEEMRLMEIMRESPAGNKTPELESLLLKAKEPDPAKVFPIVEWAQTIVKLIAGNDNGWESVFSANTPKVTIPSQPQQKIIETPKTNPIIQKGLDPPKVNNMVYPNKPPDMKNELPLISPMIPMPYGRPPLINNRPQIPTAPKKMNK